MSKIMAKCKRKNCTNEAVEGKRYCKYHRSIVEETVKGAIGVGTTLSVAGIALFRKVKK